LNENSSNAFLPLCFHNSRGYEEEMEILVRIIQKPQFYQEVAEHLGYLQLRKCRNTLILSKLYG
jgi:hypothetical protein